MLDAHPIHESINRAQQLLGGDREMVVASGVIVAVVALSIGNIWGFLLGIPIWFLLLAALQRAGKADPLIRPRAGSIRRVRTCRRTG
jgi:type IV secretion system protein VirB3